jgi:thiol-disulfide isomerase/thioredoxin
LRRSTRLLLLAVAGLTISPSAFSAQVKLVKPEQYRARVVASKKGRVLVVNFWATWCDPCREEMPLLMAASRRFSSKEIAVTIVSIDSLKKTAEVGKFLSVNKIPFVCWQAKSHDPQPFIEAVDRSWGGAVPYTIVYDRRGQIVAKLAGQQTEASFAEAIRKALSS